MGVHYRRRNELCQSAVILTFKLYFFTLRQLKQRQIELLSRLNSQLALHLENREMALMEFFGCAFIAYGPAFALFVLTIAKDPIRIIILIASAFFWLVSLLVSSLFWMAAESLDSVIAVGLVFSVLCQELFRFFIYLLLRKAEVGLKKLTDSNTEIISNKHILAYVAGLGFGLISGSFSFVNVLADAAGPGTVGLRGDSSLFFVTSAITTLCFILLHTAWGVLFFHALDHKKYLALAWVISSHLLVSCLTLLNSSQMYLATILPAVLVLIVTSIWAARIAGASLDSVRKSLTRSPLTLHVSEN